MAGIGERTIHGEPSIAIATDAVTAWMTLRGNNVAPVTFHIPGGDLQPYSLSPWKPGEIEGLDPLLDVLRGDFLCLPFGPQPQGPAHGQTSCESWTVEASGPTWVRLALEAQDVGARVTKTVCVRQGQFALFQEFEFSGLVGAFSYGTHPVLDLSGLPPASARLSHGPLVWSSVYPGVFSDPGAGETQILQPGAEFSELDAIPTIDGGVADLSRYPTPSPHEDLVMLCHRGDARGVGWTAVSAPGFVWCALKDVRDFPSTVLWISNGGRSAPPWNGRHLGRLGVEDVCSYFHAGLVDSREDRLAARGIPTARVFDGSAPTRLRSLQMVVPTASGFGRVVDVDTSQEGRLTVTDELGASVASRVDWQFVLGMT